MTVPANSGTYSTCGKFSSSTPFHRSHIASVGGTNGYTLEVAANFSGVSFFIYSPFRVRTTLCTARCVLLGLLSMATESLGNK